MESVVEKILGQITDPRLGLPILGVLVLLNAVCGGMIAWRQKAFSRAYMLTFLQTRVMQQGVPVALTGFGALFFDMYLLSWFYAASAMAMGADLAIDLVAKQKALFPFSTPK